MDKCTINQNYSYLRNDITYCLKQNQNQINEHILPCNSQNPIEEGNIGSAKIREITNLLFDKKNQLSNSNSNSFSENLKKHLYYLNSNNFDFKHLNSSNIKFEINIINNHQNNNY